MAKSAKERAADRARSARRRRERAYERAEKVRLEADRQIAAFLAERMEVRRGSPDWLSVRELGELVGLSREAIYRLKRWHEKGGDGPWS
jgi:hypothetical protein